MRDTPSVKIAAGPATGDITPDPGYLEALLPAATAPGVGERLGALAAT